MKNVIMMIHQVNASAYASIVQAIEHYDDLEIAREFINGRDVNLALAFECGIQSEMLAEAALERLNAKISSENLELWAKAWHDHYVEMAAHQFAWDQNPSADVQATYTRWKRDFHDDIQQAIQNAFDRVEVDVREYFALIQQRNQAQEKLDAMRMQQAPTMVLVLI